MKRLRNHLIGIDKGEVPLFSDFENDGDMWSGDGQRQLRSHVIFSEPFRDPPMVQLGLNMWDISNEANARADILPEDITPEGFHIVFRTWGDTKIARVRVSWIAFGELPHADDWTLY